MNNKKGVKLLATVMVLALAVTAFAVVVSDDSDATVIGPFDDVDGAKDISSPLTSGTYVVKDNTTVDVGTGSDAVKIYLADKVTLTLTGNERSEKAITIIPASADGKKFIKTDTNIIITKLIGGDISIKAAYSGSLTKASALTVSGSPGIDDTDGSIAISLGTTGDPETATGVVSVGTDGLIVTGSTTVISDLSYGSAFIDKKVSTDKIIEYTAPGSNRSYTLDSIASDAASDIVNILNGTFTVSDGTNTIKFTKYSAKATATPAVITGINNANSATKVSGGDAKDSGSVTIINGTIINNTLASIAKVFTGAVDSSNNMINQIKDDETYTVYGDYTQKKSTTDAITSVTVDNKSVMTIPEGVSMEITNLVDGGTGSIVKVFGELTAGAHSAATGKLQVGPYGKYTGDGADENTNVKTGVDNGRNGDISDVTGDFILTCESYIPAGKTLTVTGFLGISGQTLNVEGKLVIAEGAVVYTLGTTDVIVLKKTGSIENNGTLGTVEDITVSDSSTRTNKIEFSGVDGLQFGYASINGSKMLSISGNVTTNGLQKEGNDIVGTVTLTKDVAVGGDLTIGYGVTLTGTGTFEVATGSDVTIDGILDADLKIGVGASVDINGKITATTIISAYQGAVDGAGAIADETIITIDTDDTTGFTVYSEQVITDDGKEVRVYIVGAVSVINEGDEPELEVTGVLNIGVDGLVIEKEAGFDADTDSATIYLDGTIQQAGSALVITDYIGAYYTVKDESGTTPVTIYYYTTLAIALKNIDSAMNKTVSAIIIDLNDSITVSAGQTLDLDVGGDIKKGASVIVEKDCKNATIDVTGEVIGSIVVYKGASNTINLDNDADAIIVSEEKTVYAGFVTAVDMASAGDTLTVGQVESEESLTIKDGITIIADSLTVKGNLTVPETSALKTGSIILVEPVAGATPKINVAGTLDLSEGSITATKYELKSTGKTILASVDANNMSGAYYTATEGLILTTVANAVKDATEGEIVIIGKISEKTDITLAGIDLRISSAEGTEVTLGTITLDDAKVIAQGKLTATIVSKAAATTTGAADASVSIAGATITVQDIETGLQINNVAGKVNVLSGTVAIAGAATVATDSELTVAKDSKALVTGSLAANNGKITVDGELAVKGTFTSTTITPTINGTLTAMAGSTVAIEGAKVAGVIVAEETSSFTIAGSAVSVLNGGKISGEINVDNTGTVKIIKAFAGADVSAMDLGATVYSTAFYVNGDLLETIYATGTIAIPNLLADVQAIPEYSATSVTWKQADGTAAPARIGDVSALYAKVDLQTAKVKVSVGSGLSLWIDGVKQVTAETVDLTIGEHQVQVTVNPGYKGTTTITFNGQTISNGKIDITSNMVGATNVISATGDITIDTGDTPAPVEKDDSGMGITDYLLIVLVVLAAILVVIVAIRMMRS